MTGCCYRFILLCLLVQLLGCALPADFSLSYRQMPDFQSGTTVLTSVQAEINAEQLEPLLISAEMTDYFDRFMRESVSSQQRAKVLMNVLLSPAFLNIEYQRSDTLTALEVFDKASANCIGFANLYIALARHYGLEASYQLIEKYPQWDLAGNIVSMDVHVNTVVNFSSGNEVTVDIGQRSLEQVGKTSKISDEAALALFYNNLSIVKFYRGDYVDAYTLASKAIALAPELDMLWSNLGAIYRNNNQWTEAESAYKIALSLSPGSYTAMNNLAVLYQKQGRVDEAGIYLEKTRRQRNKNPYYHFYLAQKAQKHEQYGQAHEHVLQAIALKNDEPDFYQLLESLNIQLDRLAINAFNSSHTWSGLNADIQSDIASSLPLMVQRRP